MQATNLREERGRTIAQTDGYVKRIDERSCDIVRVALLHESKGLYSLY